MGNLHSTIMERLPQIAQIFNKNWISNLIVKVGQLRVELTTRMLNLFQKLQFQQLPVRQRMVRVGPVEEAPGAEWVEYQDRIELYNTNEMKLIYFVCAMNILFLGVFLRYLFYWFLPCISKKNSFMYVNCVEFENFVK